MLEGLNWKTGFSKKIDIHAPPRSAFFLVNQIYREGTRSTLIPTENRAHIDETFDFPPKTEPNSGHMLMIHKVHIIYSSYMYSLTIVELRSTEGLNRLDHYCDFVSVIILRLLSEGGLNYLRMRRKGTEGGWNCSCVEVTAKSQVPSTALEYALAIFFLIWSA